MPSPVLSTSYAPDASSVLFGDVVPRLFTPPLVSGPAGPCGCGCALSPDTSYGFDVAEFAERVLRLPLDPWQRWAAIHMGELLPDGRPRFRVVVTLVARQNGKTHLLRVLALFWLFVERWPMVLGTSTNLQYAREAWEAAVDLAESVPELADLVAAVRRTNGEQALRTVEGARYLIAASNRRGGRSLSIDRLIVDELREHDDWSAWNAAVPAMNARPYAQAVCITNQGDDTSVVLESLRDAALRFLETGVGDRRLGLLEWSAPDDCEVDDPRAWAAANPNLGYRMDVDTIAGPAARAKAAGGEEAAGFRTEVLCIRVRMLNPALDPAAWKRCHDPGRMDDVASRVALCVDLSPDALHATLAAAAVLPDGRVRVEVVAAWDGSQAVAALRRDLPVWIRRVRPQALGWLPSGPAATLAADLADRRKKGRVGWPPPGVTVEEVRGEVTAVCMGFAEQVAAGRVAHSGDALLDAQVAGAERLKRGDAWCFSRAGAGYVDAVYAVAGAVHLARTLPTPVGKPRLIVSR